MSHIYEEYQRKLKTPDEAVKLVKSGDWVDYSTAVAFPVLLDEALAKRRDELFDVKIRGNLCFGPIQVAECDPTREHFCYNSWHCSGYERALCDRNLCNYIPMVFRDMTSYYRRFLTVNVAMISVPPMDARGYFNFSCVTGTAKGILEKADIIILEINEHLPWVNGLYDDVIHISDVDCIVEGTHPPLPNVYPGDPTEADYKIAEYIVPQIPSGATLQLGIGSMPNVIGASLVDSDIKDLGMHTELCGDAYVHLDNAGKLTNRQKKLYHGKGIAGMIFGSPFVYEWANQNPGIASAPLEFINAPSTIAQMDNMISINSCIAVDLFGQICAESAGLRHISGTGGQLDFLTGASMSNGGKGFICLPSCFTDKKGVKHSNILPHFQGNIVTDPRSQAYMIVTEYGCVRMLGNSTWERAENLISIAHPDFREELIQAAEAQHIWKQSNKR